MGLVGWKGVCMLHASRLILNQDVLPPGMRGGTRPLRWACTLCMPYLVVGLSLMCVLSTSVVYGTTLYLVEARVCWPLGQQLTCCYVPVVGHGYMGADQKLSNA